jgi:hypothetical protein
MKQGYRARDLPATSLAASALAGQGQGIRVGPEVTTPSPTSPSKTPPPSASFSTGSQTPTQTAIDDAGGAVHSHAGLDAALDGRVAFFFQPSGMPVGGADVDRGVVAYGGFACVCYGSGDMGSAASVSSSLLRTGGR